MGNSGKEIIETRTKDTAIGITRKINTNGENESIKENTA